MKKFSSLEKFYIAKNVNSKTTEEMGAQLKCTGDAVKKEYERMKSAGEYDRYRLMTYQEAKALEEEKKEETPKVAEEENSLLDLNKYLFDQLRALNDKSLTEQEFKNEVERSKAMVNVSQTIINNEKLLLEASKHFQKREKNILKALGVGEE